MTLETKLLIVFFAFLAILAGVITVVVRARNTARAADEQGVPAQGVSDDMILVVIFGAVLMGALLALIVAWIVFF
jgi:hypothetical protein